MTWRKVIITIMGIIVIVTAINIALWFGLKGEINPEHESNMLIEEIEN